MPVARELGTGTLLKDRKVTVKNPVRKTITKAARIWSMKLIYSVWRNATQTGAAFPVVIRNMPYNRT